MQLLQMILSSILLSPSFTPFLSQKLASFWRLLAKLSRGRNREHPLHQTLEDISVCNMDQIGYSYLSGSELAFLYFELGERTFLEAGLMLSDDSKDLGVVCQSRNTYKANRWTRVGRIDVIHDTSGFERVDGR